MTDRQVHLNEIRSKEEGIPIDEYAAPRRAVDPDRPVRRAAGDRRRRGLSVQRARELPHGRDDSGGRRADPEHVLMHGRRSLRDRGALMAAGKLKLIVVTPERQVVEARGRRGPAAGRARLPRHPSGARDARHAVEDRNPFLSRRRDPRTRSPSSSGFAEVANDIGLGARGPRRGAIARSTRGGRARRAQARRRR